MAGVLRQKRALPFAARPQTNSGPVRVGKEPYFHLLKYRTVNPHGSAPKPDPPEVYNDSVRKPNWRCRMKLNLRIITSVLLAAAPLWAHHGSAGYDQNKPVHLVGKVSLVDWTNPHVVIHLEVTGEDGKTATWLVNTLPPATATRIGFPKNSFAAGTEITVECFQATDGSNHVNGTRVMFNDGRKIVTPDCFSAREHCFTPGEAKANRVQ
jgi:hypothetical protein